MIKKVYNNISNNKKLEIIRKIDGLQMHLASKLIYYVEELLKEKGKIDLNKRADIQDSIENLIKDLGMKTFNNKIKENDLNDLFEVLENHNKNKNKNIELKDI